MRWTIRTLHDLADDLQGLSQSAEGEALVLGADYGSRHNFFVGLVSNDQSKWCHTVLSIKQLVKLRASKAGGPAWNDGNTDSSPTDLDSKPKSSPPNCATLCTESISMA
jgi:hypothetical protein